MLIINWITILDIKTDTDLVARKYLLRIETEGYLTDQDRVSLLKELDDLGIKEVSLNGSTLDEVKYGTECVLRISGKISESFLELNGLGLMLGSDALRFDITRTSTAKN